MKVRDIMTANPVCCTPQEKAHKVAKIMCEHNVGSVPVVTDQESRKLMGMITDRDLCCGIVAQGLDPKTTSIEALVTTPAVSCRDGENAERCEKAMQEHQVRRIPVVDGDGRCVGIVAQADVALKDKPDKVSKTVAEISKPASGSILAA